MTKTTKQLNRYASRRKPAKCQHPIRYVKEDANGNDICTLCGKMVYKVKKTQTPSK